MRSATLRALLLLPLLVLPAGSRHVLGQGRDNPVGPPEPPPPPMPRRSDRDNDREKDRRGIVTLAEDLIEESDSVWELPDDLRLSLASRAEVYREYTRQFTCTETARAATYRNGVAERETVRRYSYLLTADESTNGFNESRRTIGRKGDVKRGEVKDEEPFPPAYAWVFMFSETNQQFFSYRDRGDRFDGFDWVREIEFRGALPFTDGRDIRQWEGIIVIDAAQFTPIEIRAEPSNQRRRLQAMFERWTSAFNLVGLRLAPRPFGYRCRVEFRHLADGLNFPTRLRYDTFRSYGPKEIVRWRASSRGYGDYRFFEVNEKSTIGKSASGRRSR